MWREIYDGCVYTVYIPHSHCQHSCGLKKNAVYLPGVYRNDVFPAINSSVYVSCRSEHSGGSEWLILSGKKQNPSTNSEQQQLQMEVADLRQKSLLILQKLKDKGIKVQHHWLIFEMTPHPNRESEEHEWMQVYHQTLTRLPLTPETST